MQFEVAQVTGAPEDVKTVSSLDAAQRVIVAEGYEGVKLPPRRTFLIISPAVGRKLNDQQGDPG
jgi:hypothetical protein